MAMAEKFTTRRPQTADEDSGQREQARDADLLESAEQKQADEVGPRQQSDPTEDQPDLGVDPAAKYRGETADDQIDEAASEFDSPDDLVDDGTGKEGEVTVHDPTEGPDLVPDSEAAKSELLGSAEVLTDPLRDALDPTGQPDPTRGADLASDDGHDANLDKLRASVAEYKADLDDLEADYGGSSEGGGDTDGPGSSTDGGGDTYVMERGGSLTDKMSDEGIEGIVKKGLNLMGGGNDTEPIYRNTRTDELVDAEHLPKDATIVDGRSQLGEQEKHPDNETGTAPEEGRTLWGDISNWYDETFGDGADEANTAPPPESGDGDASDPSRDPTDPPPPESSDGDQLVDIEGIEQLSPFWRDDVEFGPSVDEVSDNHDMPEYIGDGGDTGADTGMARPGGESAPDDPIVKAHLAEQQQKMLDILGYNRPPPRSGTIDPTEADAGEAEGGQIAPPGVDDPPEDEEQPQGEPEGEVPMGQPGAIDPSEEDDIGTRTGIEEDVPGEDELFDDGTTLDLPGDGSPPPFEPPTTIEVDHDELADRLSDDGIDPGEVFLG